MSKKLIITLSIIFFIVVVFTMTNFKHRTLDDTAVNVENKTLINDVDSSNNELQSKNKIETVSPNIKLDVEVKKQLHILLNTSSDGLEEVQTKDGVMVDLKGRFRTVPVANVNESGEVNVEDFVSPPKN